MFCKYCGKEISDDAEFCPACGKPTGVSQGAGVPQTTDGAQPPAPEQTELKQAEQTEPVQAQQPVPEQNADYTRQSYEGQSEGYTQQSSEGQNADYADYRAATAPEAKPDGYAIASLVLGILGLFFIPIVGGILGIVFGNVSMKNIGRTSMARAGKILGIIGLVIWIILIVIIIIAVAVLGTVLTQTMMML